jgi:cation transport regulator ChaC
VRLISGGGGGGSGCLYHFPGCPHHRAATVAYIREQNENGDCVRRHLNVAHEQRLVASFNGLLSVKPPRELETIVSVLMPNMHFNLKGLELPKPLKRACSLKNHSHKPIRM